MSVELGINSGKKTGTPGIVPGKETCTFEEYIPLLAEIYLKNYKQFGLLKSHSLILNNSRTWSWA